MPKVDVSINGRSYAVACDEGQQDRVRELAGMVDSRVKQLVGPGPVGGVGETQILVLAGLMLADELTETKASLGGQAKPAAQAEPALSAEDEELLVAAVDHLTDRIGVIADRLARA